MDMRASPPGAGNPAATVISVLIADDQPLMRAALRTCVLAEPDLELAGEARTGLEAVDLAERLRPTVTVMDIRMPDLDGVSAIRRLVADRSGDAHRVLAITTFDLDDYVFEALRAGASGFLLKDATAEELVHAIRVVAAGDALLSPGVTRRLLDRYARRLPPVTHQAQDAVNGLTQREREVLELAARGPSNTEVATALKVAPSSVKSHLAHVFTKLNLTSRVQLVIFAYEHGLITPGTLRPSL
jgi:DNA-binding NarL/FixJ family response regulator